MRKKQDNHIWKKVKSFVFVAERIFLRPITPKKKIDYRSQNNINNQADSKSVKTLFALGLKEPNLAESTLK